MSKTDKVLLTILASVMIPLLVVVGFSIHDAVKNYNRTGYFSVDKKEIFMRRSYYDWTNMQR